MTRTGAALLAAALAGTFLATSGAASGADDVQTRLQLCAACHGPGGNSRTPGIPSLAGQPRTFIETQLILYREGVRSSAAMTPPTKGLTDAEITALATHFSRAPLESSREPAKAEIVKRGQDVAKKLVCDSCHLPDYRGRDQIPRLAGQREDYLVQSMLAFRDNPRPGADTIMTAVLYRVPDADIRALAHFLSRLAGD